jgi:WD40 repeat protein
MAVAADNSLYSLTDTASIQLWDFKNRVKLNTFEVAARSIQFLMITPDNRYLVAWGVDNILRVWDIDGSEVIGKIKTDADMVFDMDVSGSGGFAAAACRSGEIKIWNLKKERYKHSINAFTIPYSLDISPDDRHIVFGGKDGQIRVWDLEEKWMNRVFEGHSDAVRIVRFFNDGDFVISAGDDKTVRIWDYKTALRQAALEGHGKPPSVLDVSKDNRYAVSADNDGCLFVWDLNKYAQAKKVDLGLKMTKAVVVLDDSEYAVAAGSGSEIKKVLIIDKFKKAMEYYSKAGFPEEAAVNMVIHEYIDTISGKGLDESDFNAFVQFYSGYGKTAYSLYETIAEAMAVRKKYEKAAKFFKMALDESMQMKNSYGEMNSYQRLIEIMQILEDKYKKMAEDAALDVSETSARGAAAEYSLKSRKCFIQKEEYKRNLEKMKKR